MGDDESNNSTEEGVQVNLLSRTIKPLACPSHLILTAYRNVRAPKLKPRRTQLLTEDHRDEKHMAQTRSFLYIPPLLFPTPHIPRLGSSIRGRLLQDAADNARLYIRPLPRALSINSFGGILLGWEVARSWRPGTAGKEETRLVHAARRRRAA